MATTKFSFHAQLNTPSSSAAFRFRIFSAFPSNDSPHFREVFSTLKCSLLCLIRLQFSTCFNQSMSFIIPVLIALLQLKYQENDKKSPFSTHPTTMLVAVSSFAVYCLANIALLRFPLPRYAFVVYNWSAYALFASLASVLFPDSFSPFVYVVFVLLSAAELLYLLYHKLVVDEGAEFPRRGLGRFLKANIWRVVGNFSGKWPPLLPV